MSKKQPVAKKVAGKKTAKTTGTVHESVAKVPGVPESEIALASANETVVGSTQSPSATDNQPGVQQDAPTGKDTRIMELKYKGLSKSGKFALYSGLRTVTRLSITDFPDSKPIPSFEVSGDFAGPREPKPKMTAEERKAYRLAHPRPKLTIAEKIAKQEQALAKLRAKASQPEGEAVSV